MLYGTTASWSIGRSATVRVLYGLGSWQAISSVPTQGAIDRLDHAPTVAGTAILIVGVLALTFYATDQYRTASSGVESGAEQQQQSVLTDRERVERLLDQNGGRMKQSDIVDSVEWSKAKVSRLLADLESDGEITKLRLGRENLICRAGSEPAASRSGPNRPGTQSGDE